MTQTVRVSGKVVEVEAPAALMKEAIDEAMLPEAPSPKETLPSGLCSALDGFSIVVTMLTFSALSVWQ